MSSPLERATLVDLIRRSAWLIEYYGSAADSQEFVNELKSTMAQAVHQVETPTLSGSTPLGNPK